jgi:hypothetical protein
LATGAAAAELVAGRSGWDPQAAAASASGTTKKTRFDELRVRRFMVCS